MTQTAKTPADPPLCVCKGSQSRLAFQDPPCVSPGAHPEPKSLLYAPGSLAPRGPLYHPAEPPTH